MEKWIRLTGKLDRAIDYVFSAVCVGFAIFLILEGQYSFALIFGLLGFNIVKALHLEKLVVHFQTLYLAQSRISNTLAEAIIELKGTAYLEEILEVNQPATQSHEPLEHSKK